MNASGNKIDELIDKIKNEKMNSPQIPGINKIVNRPDLSFDKLRRPQNLAFTQRTSELELDKNDKKLKEIMKSSGKLLIKDQIYDTDIKDLIQIEELGTGTCGHVVKMRHKPSNEIIAVKQMRRTGNNKEENKRIVMDIEVNKSHDCPYIVQCLGCFITEPEVWICMELMATCFDKLSKRLKQPIPEKILGKVTVATVKALAYLKDKHGIIHRDVKPSNILLDEKGNVKLCDFGISGRLVDSMAATKSAGCTAYLAPERIEINPSHPEYDIRADVWSLGITLVELATGKFPYQDCKTDFEVLTKVIGQDPPSLPEDQDFSPEFRSFVKCCLIKDQMQRPKYVKLKKEPFYKRYETAEVDVGEWYRRAMQQVDGGSKDSSRQNSKTSSTSQFRRVLHTRQHSEPPPPRRNFLNGTEPTHQHFPPTEDFTDSRSVHVSRLATFNERQNRNYSPGLYHDRQESCFLQKRDRWNSPVTSPLPHHRNMHEDTSLPYNSGNTSPIVLQRFLHQQKQQQQAKEAEEYLKNDTGRRRLPSYIKQMSNDRSGRSSRHQSPEPPPRLNRGVGENQSPLAMRRHILEPNPNSPGFSRRYISPTPPVPPPRRLSESTSVPGSPQHVRAKFHYTPEPQRRLFRNHDVS